MTLVCIPRPVYLTVCLTAIVNDKFHSRQSLHLSSSRSALKGDFCGDVRCDEATEDRDSCPMDCCPYDNVEKCQVVNNTCPDECCGQPLCCRIPLDGPQPPVIFDLFIWIIVGVAGLVVLVNLCCCFCCICCAKRCCKKRKKDKHGKKGHDKDKSTPVWFLNLFVQFKVCLRVRVFSAYVFREL